MIAISHPSFSLEICCHKLIELEFKNIFELSPNLVSIASDFLEKFQWTEIDLISSSCVWVKVRVQQCDKHLAYEPTYLGLFILKMFPRFQEHKGIS